MKILRFAVRWTLTGIILWYVWRNSHWSVWLCLTLIFLSLELTGFILDQLIAALRDLSRVSQVHLTQTPPDLTRPLRRILEMSPRRKS